jgi:hypothetical protein
MAASYAPAAIPGIEDTIESMIGFTPSFGRLFYFIRQTYDKPGGCCH